MAASEVGFMLNTRPEGRVAASFFSSLSSDGPQGCQGLADEERKGKSKEKGNANEKF